MIFLLIIIIKDELDVMCFFGGVWGEIGKDLFDDKACGCVLDGKTYLLIQLI